MPWIDDTLDMLAGDRLLAPFERIAIDVAGQPRKPIHPDLYGLFYQVTAKSMQFPIKRLLLWRKH